jgi:hypothetical protein
MPRNILLHILTCTSLNISDIHQEWVKSVRRYVLEFQNKKNTISYVQTVGVDWRGHIKIHCWGAYNFLLYMQFIMHMRTQCRRMLPTKASDLNVIYVITLLYDELCWENMNLDTFFIMQELHSNDTNKNHSSDIDSNNTFQRILFTNFEDIGYQRANTV